MFEQDPERSDRELSREIRECTPLVPLVYDAPSPDSMDEEGNFLDVVVPDTQTSRDVRGGQFEQARSSARVTMDGKGARKSRITGGETVTHAPTGPTSIDETLIIMRFRARVSALFGRRRQGRMRLRASSSPNQANPPGHLRNNSREEGGGSSGMV